MFDPCVSGPTARKWIRLWRVPPLFQAQGWYLAFEKSADVHLLLGNRKARVQKALLTRKAEKVKTEEATQEKETLRRQRIRSLGLIPLKRNQLRHEFRLRLPRPQTREKWNSYELRGTAWRNMPSTSMPIGWEAKEQICQRLPSTI